MKKSEFIDELCRKLRLMPPDEAQKTVLFYSEAIDDRIEDGLSEEDAVAAMGNIDDIVREVLGSAPRSDTSYTSDSSTADEELGRHERSFSPDGVKNLTIGDTSCGVRLEPSSDGLIHIIYTNAQGFRYQITEGSNLTVKKVIEKQFSFRAIFSGGASGDELTVRIPYMPKLSVSVSTASGDISVRLGELWQIFAKSASGDIEVSGLKCTDSIDLVSVSGDASADGVTCSKLRLSTVSGEASAKGVCCGETSINTVSGDAKVNGAVNGRLSMHSVSGDTQCHLSAFCKKLEFDTLSGKVSARLPGSESDYAVSVKTASGRCRAPMDSTFGTCSLRAKTASGNIDISFSV